MCKNGKELHNRLFMANQGQWRHNKNFQRNVLILLAKTYQYEETKKYWVCKICGIQFNKHYYGLMISEIMINHYLKCHAIAGGWIQQT